MNAVRPANRRRSASGIIRAFVARGYGPTLRTPADRSWPDSSARLRESVPLRGAPPADTTDFAAVRSSVARRQPPLHRDSTLLSLPGRAGGGRWGLSPSASRCSRSPSRGRTHASAPLPTSSFSSAWSSVSWSRAPSACEAVQRRATQLLRRRTGAAVVIDGGQSSPRTSAVRLSSFRGSS